MSRFFSQRLAGLTPYIPGEQPQGMQNLIKLNTNENPFPPSPAVMQAISGEEIEKLRLYSDPDCADFLEVLAQVYGVKPAQVFASNGSDEVLAFCFQAFCEQGAAFPDLTYGFYPVFSQLFAIEQNIIPLQTDFTVNIEDYARQNGTVFLANPNAPTAIAIGLKEIEALLRQNPDRLIVVDEAYVDFGGESAVPLLERYENLLVVGTFSKSRNLAGARLGYAIGSEELIADLNTIKFSFNPYNVNRLTLQAGIAALQDTAYFEQCCQSIIATRDKTATALRALGFAVTDSKTNFLFAGAHPNLSGTQWYETLRENGILVRHFSQPRIEDYVRVTVGTSEQMDAFLAVTRKLLNKE